MNATFSLAFKIVTIIDSDDELTVLGKVEYDMGFKKLTYSKLYLFETITFY